MRLNDQIAARTNLPEGKADHILWDEAIPGFCLRVRKAAAGVSKQWVFTYRDALGASRRFTIGAAALPAAQARKTAAELHAGIKLGKYPHVAREEQRKAAEHVRDKTSETFGALAAVYLDRQAKRLRAGSLALSKRNIEVHLAPFHRVSIHQISRRMVSEQLLVIETKSGPHARNHARTTIIAFYNWAIGEGLIETNPSAFTNMAEVKPRGRTLSRAELMAIWGACREDDFGRIVKLLMLTGQRRTEVGGMRWDEVDIDRGLWVMQGERTKNGQEHKVPLVPEAIEIIRSVPRRGYNPNVFGAATYGFAGWHPAKKTLHARAGFAEDLDWRLHDLRRSMKTHMSQELDIRAEVSEALLNHVKRGLEGVYNTADYVRQKRAALDSWTNYLRPARGANVVQFATRAAM
jgi:integrase